MRPKLAKVKVKVWTLAIAALGKKVQTRILNDYLSNCYRMLTLQRIQYIRTLTFCTKI